MRHAGLMLIESSYIRCITTTNTERRFSDALIITFRFRYNIDTILTEYREFAILISILIFSKQCTAHWAQCYLCNQHKIRCRNNITLDCRLHYQAQRGPNVVFTTDEAMHMWTIMLRKTSLENSFLGGLYKSGWRYTDTFLGRNVGQRM